MTEPPVHNERWLRIKALFPCAVEQPPEALGAWLDAECGDDEELRQDLESLLASHQSASTFMQAPAIAAPGAASAVAERLAPGIRAAMVDRRLGPYRLVSELGRGGMGVVYLAERDDQAFDRQVAVKMVHGGLLHPSLVDRFEAERRILARFEHPNIARLIDAGTDDMGTPYAVMEYVRGTPIDAYARDHSLSTVSRLQLFCGFVVAGRQFGQLCSNRLRLGSELEDLVAALEEGTGNLAGLAALALELGDRQAAAQYYRQAQKLRPHDPQIARLALQGQMSRQDWGQALDNLLALLSLSDRPGVDAAGQ